MASLADALHQQVPTEAVTALQTLLDRRAGSANPPTTITSGAVPLTTRTTFLSATGTVAYTLANGTYEGQRKTVRCTVAASTPHGVLTPASKTGFTSVEVNTVEDWAELEWHGSTWRLVAQSGCTVV